MTTLDPTASLVRDRTSLDTPSLESDTSEHSYHLEVRPKRPRGEARRSEEQRESFGSAQSAQSGTSNTSALSARSGGDSPFATAEAQSTPITRDSMDENRDRQTERQGSGTSGWHRPGQVLTSVDERHASGPSPAPTGPRRSAERSGSAGSAPTPHGRMAAFRDYRQQIGTKGAFSLELPPQDQAAIRRGVRVSFDLANAQSAREELPIARELVGRLVRKRRRLPLPWVIGFGIVSSSALLVGLTTLSVGLYNFTKLRANRAQKSIQGLEDDLFPKFDEINASLAAVQMGLEGLAGVIGRRGGP